METIISRFDTDNQYNWSEIHTARDENGVIVSRHTLYDNGLLKDVNYENGTLSYVQWLDQSYDGLAANWQTRVAEYDAEGNVKSNFTQFDNDIIKIENFENGVRTFIEQQDQSQDGLAANWQTRVAEYDAEGNIKSNFTQFDNDIIKIENFENGVRTFIEQQDQSQDGLAANWQTQVNEYDAEGNLTTKFTQFDNNIEKNEGFKNGIRTYIVKEDLSEDGLAANWKFLSNQYDTEGSLISQNIKYDNGVESYRFFTDGVLRHRLEGDYSEDGSAVNWQALTIFYDAAGNVEKRNTTYDNGIDEFIKYTGGVRSENLQLDNSADGLGQDWGLIRKNYDENGKLASKVTYFDDTDSIFEFYDEGTIQARLGIDGDDDKDWFAKEILYDADGEKTDVIFYETAEDIPEFYEVPSGYLDTIA
ncbi:hypothetical protein F9L33_12000 [Amylibacter sp. SFDW26]|uniref:hypothetical protein n=1 Tax=Amylibacter sp. SFDW26 TaxID=2652722 RepID=UPI001261D53F|nr:hypothetical protein [Amylibacter sp. SFDW26]KAB7613321.1 hypothetical protein F9L33_12000 [Amylibacter sp. SFDW26]